jgi:hypothetical protein
MGNQPSTPGALALALKGENLKKDWCKLSDGRALTLSTLGECAEGLFPDESEEGQDNDPKGKGKEKVTTATSGNSSDRRKFVAAVTARFEELVETKEGRHALLGLPLGAVIELLKSDDLQVEDEFGVFLFAGAWADHRVKSAQQESTSGRGAGKQTYADKMRQALEPLLPHIRFPMMASSSLLLIEDAGDLVPLHYLTEAYRHQSLQSGFAAEDEETVPRFRPRKYCTLAEWDPTWHGQHIQVSGDGKTANKVNQGWYSVAFGREGYNSGRHYWAIQVGGDETYVGVARKEMSQLDNYLGCDANSWAWNYSGYISTQASTSVNTSYGGSFGRGDIIGIALDMNKKTLSFYKNGQDMGVAFSNLPSVKLYPAVGWRAGQQKFVPVNFRAKNS